MSDEIKWDKLQDYYGWSDAQIEEIKGAPNLMKVLKVGPRILKSRFIAEVVHSEGCTARLKPGDRYVFNLVGILLPEKTTGNICIEAMGPLMLPRRVAHDRVVEGLDPNGMLWRHVKCMDTGLKSGGMGQVLWKVRVEVPD